MRPASLISFGTFVVGFALLGWTASCGDETEPDRDLDSDDDGGAGGAMAVTGATTGAGVTVGGEATTGSTMATTGSGQTTTSGGMVCSDKDQEPNDTEATAVNLGNVSDCDDIHTVLGTLNGNDVDWFRYNGSDDACIVQGSRSIVADATVQICKYYECPELQLDCPNGTMAVTSPQGRPGCCSSEDFSVAPDCNGFGFDDTSTVYIRLDKAPAVPCVDYTLSYEW